MKYNNEAVFLFIGMLSIKATTMELFQNAIQIISISNDISVEISIVDHVKWYIGMFFLSKSIFIPKIASRWKVLKKKKVQ